MERKLCTLHKHETVECRQTTCDVVPWVRGRCQTAYGCTGTAGNDEQQSKRTLIDVCWVVALEFKLSYSLRVLSMYHNNK